MKSRAKARRLAHNNREYILFSRQQAGDCTFCPRHDGENIRGNHSKWGKKRAAKRCYVTGRGRKPPKVYRVGYTYKNYGIDIVPGRKEACPIKDKGWMCEWNWEWGYWQQQHNKVWDYPERRNMVK